MTDTVAEVPADPLLNAMVSRVTAQSRWNAGGCVPVGTPIASGISELADANVITGTPMGEALVALNNAEGDTVYSRSTTELVDVAGQAGKGVKSKALTQLTGITLFKGTPDQLTVNVLAPPVVEATATGKAGGAKVTYSEPILQIVDAENNILGELNAAEGNIEIDASPLVTLRLGHLAAETKPDGTQASGRATLLEVIVLDEPDAIEPLARLTVAGGVASASVPAGGVNCAGVTGGGPVVGDDDECGPVDPLRDLRIEPSAPTVTAGSTFTYTITVSNAGECTLTNVRVETTIDGPPGSEVTATQPEADSVDGLTVIWNDVGPLDPGASKELVVTVDVPADADDGDEYSGTVDVSATGGGSDFDGSASVNGPLVGGEVAVGGVQLPATGASIAALVVGGIGLIVTGEFLRRRSRRWSLARGA